MSDLVITTEEVAKELGCQAAWLRRNWRRLVRDRGMPRQLPGSDGRWPRVAMELWLSHGDASPAFDATGPVDDPVSRERQALYLEMGLSQ